MQYYAFVHAVWQSEEIKELLHLGVREVLFERSNMVLDIVNTAVNSCAKITFTGAKQSRIVKGLRFYLTWKLQDCLMDAGRRHKIPGPETKDRLLLTAIVVARVTSLLHCFIKPQFLQGDMKEPSNACTCSGLHFKRGTPILGNSNLLYWIVSLPELCPEGRHYLFYF